MRLNNTDNFRVRVVWRLRGKKRNRRDIFAQIMKDMLLKSLKRSLTQNERFMSYFERIENGAINPYLACEEILEDQEIWQEVFSNLTRK